MIAYLSQHEGESVHSIWPTNKQTNKQQAITAQHKDIQQSNHFGMRPWRCCWWKWQLKQKVITTGHGPRTNCADQSIYNIYEYLFWKQGSWTKPINWSIGRCCKSSNRGGSNKSIFWTIMITTTTTTTTLFICTPSLKNNKDKIRVLTAWDNHRS